MWKTQMLVELKKWATNGTIIIAVLRFDWIDKQGQKTRRKKQLPILIWWRRDKSRRMPHIVVGDKSKQGR